METSENIDVPKEECSSNEDEMSFVLAELEDSASDLMTQSKYAMVVFPEIADCYPNDCDILCKFTYNMDMSVSTASHRIGLYRVPYFAPHEYISFQWVSDSTNDLKNGGTVVFKSTVLPKDEDFYQFQYLWIDNGSEAAIGASVPFQLRSPKTEELCTMEDEEEFMVVRSNTSLITEQMSGQLGSLSSTNESLKDKLKEGEKKYSELLGFSEVLNADLGKKSEAYLKLEEQNLILLDEKNKWEQLKTDLACVIQDKLVLEERLHRHQKALQTIQMDRDLMAGERDQANREISLLKEERTQIIANSEQVKNMLNAVSKSNAELAVFKSSNQEQQKLITNLAKKLETLEANNALKYTEIDELKQKLLLKEREFEILSQEMVNRSKTKFNEIDVLKKQLSDAERNLCKYVEAKESSSMTHEDFPTMSDEPIKSKLDNIEKTVRETQSEMREFMAKSSGTSSRMTSETASMSSMATTDSRRLLEDRVIQSHLGLNEPEQSDNEANEAAEDFEDESLSTPIRKLNDMMLGFKEIEDSPRAQAYAGARPKVASYEAVSVSTSPMGPPCAAATPTNSEAVSASTSPMALTKSPKSPLERAQSTLYQFLPQFPGSVFTNAYEFRATCQEPKRSSPIQEQPRQMPEPLIPEIVRNPWKTGALTNEDDLDLSNLVSWAAGSLKTTHNGDVVITDDGRTMTVEEASLGCPICEVKFQVGEVKALELHVDGHLASRLYCPLCNQEFALTARDEFQGHVQEHFAGDEVPRTASNWSFLDID